VSEVVPFPNEMIEKLITAGYLRREYQHNANAITSAIANIKQDLRNGGRHGNQSRRVHGPSRDILTHPSPPA
jgi:hypothetical protein